MLSIDQPDQPEGNPTYTFTSTAAIKQALVTALKSELALTGKDLDDLSFLSLNEDVNGHGTMQIILSK